MSGLFDTFTIAKRGLNVNQSAINTTSHNISNANTEGYSRQRAVAETTRPFGGTSKFDTCSVGQVGTGAEITSIQRVRDSFLDYQVRSETGTSSYYTSISDTLSKVEDIFGEPSDTGIQELVGKFYNSFQELSKNPDKSDSKTVAIKSASALADAINYTYNQLKKTNENNQSTLQSDVTDVNSYLDQINALNKQIREVSAVGETPNDLMDTRDNLLDKLSSEFGIKIDKDDFQTINLSSTEYPNSALVKSDPNDTGYSRLSYVKSATAVKDSSGKLTGEIKVEYYPLGDAKAVVKSFTISANGTTDSEKATNAQNLVDKLNQCRILIGDKDGTVETSTTMSASDINKKIFKTYSYETDSTGTAINSVDNNNVKGQIAGTQSVQGTINGYMNNLDRLAASLAYSVNAIQAGSLGTANTNLKNSDLVFVTYDENTKSNTTTDTGITAGNIRVNSALIQDSNKLNCNTTSVSGDGDGKRANAIANLNVLKMNIGNVGENEDLTTMTRKQFLNEVGVTGFSDTSCLSLNAGTDGSTIDSYYKTIINDLGTASQEATRKTTSEQTILDKLNDDRSSVSGVSLDEETTNLIQYQHAYQANAKVISTVDELLDVVINGLKK